MQRKSKLYDLAFSNRYFGASGRRGAPRGARIEFLTKFGLKSLVAYWAHLPHATAISKSLFPNKNGSPLNI